MGKNVTKGDYMENSVDKILLRISQWEETIKEEIERRFKHDLKKKETALFGLSIIAGGLRMSVSADKCTTESVVLVGKIISQETEEIKLASAIMAEKLGRKLSTKNV